MIRQFSIFLCIILFFQATAFSQLGGTHNYLDTSYISPRKMNQQSDFLQNKANFPSKPRDMWQFGVFVGLPYVDGDCPMAIKGSGNDLGNYSYGFGVHIRKAIGYVVSIRASFAYYNMLGLDYQPNSNFNNHPKIQELYANAPKGYVHNFRCRSFVPSVEALVSFNNIMFHAKQQRWNLYGLLGYSGLIYNTRMDLVGTDGLRYAYEDVTVHYNGNAQNEVWSRRQLRSALRKMMNGSYETQAQVNDRRPGVNDEWHLRHCFSSGLGIEYRMGKTWSLNFEYKRIQTRDDYVDGWYRQSGDLRYPVFTSEWDNIAFGQIGANFNIGNSKKRTAPLWWLNPLEFAYSELTNPKRIPFPKQKLTDSDNDGVLDELDLEPNTPEGCPVDTHGITKDTDGDGVPDCKDKEILTQLKCFPVDADGVGNCPEPKCCLDKPDTGIVIPTRCEIGDLPSIHFNGNTLKLSNDAKAVLATVADKIKNNPNCNVRLIGYGASDKRAQQNSWARVNAVIRYLVEQEGVAETRFIFTYGQTGGDVSTVDLQGTMESGPNTAPEPHPQLNSRKGGR